MSTSTTPTSKNPSRPSKVYSQSSPRHSKSKNTKSGQKSTGGLVSPRYSTSHVPLRKSPPPPTPQCNSTSQNEKKTQNVENAQTAQIEKSKIEHQNNSTTEIENDSKNATEIIDTSTPLQAERAFNQNELKEQLAKAVPKSQIAKSYDSDNLPQDSIMNLHGSVDESVDKIVDEKKSPNTYSAPILYSPNEGMVDRNELDYMTVDSSFHTMESFESPVKEVSSPTVLQEKVEPNIYTNSEMTQNDNSIDEDHTYKLSSFNEEYISDHVNGDYVNIESNSTSIYSSPLARLSNVHETNSENDETLNSDLTSILHSYGENSNFQALFQPTQYIHTPQFHRTINLKFVKVASCNLFSAFLTKDGEVILNGKQENWTGKPFVLSKNNMIYMRVEGLVIDIASTLESCFILTKTASLFEITSTFDLRKIETPRKFQRLYAGLVHLFGYTSNDKLWGIRGSGSTLGIGNEKSHEENSSEFQKMKLTKVPKYKIVKVACGLEHSIILRKNGTVWVCGRNDRGQLGLSNNKKRVKIPIMLSDDYFRMSRADRSTTNYPTSIIDIAAGATWSIFLGKDQSIYVCGDNSFRALGNQFESIDVFGIRRLSNDLTFNSKIEKIFCSFSQTFFCSRNEIYCTKEGSNLPKRMPLRGNNIIIQVSASQNQTFVLSDPSGESKPERKASRPIIHTERTRTTTATRADISELDRQARLLIKENITLKQENESLLLKIEELEAKNKHLAELSSSQPFLDIKVNVAALLSTVEDHIERRDRYLAEYRFSANSNLDKFSSIVRELLSKERVFLSNMKMLKETFLDPFDAKHSLPVCFREVEAVLKLSENHLSSLEEALYPWIIGKCSKQEMEIKLAEHFLFFSESFKLYMTYMLQHTLMIEALKDEPLKTFMKNISKVLKAQRTSGSDVYQIGSLLIMPVQHSCRVALHMGRLIEELDEKDPNLPIFVKAYEKIKEVGHYNNERLREYENAKTLQDLQEHISTNVLEAHRKLLFIDEYAHRITTNGDLIPCRIFICTDLLIIADSTQFDATKSSKGRGASIKPRTSVGPSRGSSIEANGKLKVQLIFQSKVCEYDITQEKEGDTTIVVLYISLEGRQEKRKIHLSDTKYYEQCLKSLGITHKVRID